MDDSKIVDLFLERDEAALRHTSEKYGKRLRTLSYRIVEDFQTAEECENDTYAAAWNTIPPHSPKEHLYAFLARITRHISLNCCRYRGSLKRSAHICELSAEMEQCIPAPDDCACRIEDMAFADVINRFLASMPVEKRNIFLRRYWYLDSIDMLAARYGLRPGAVKTRLHRTREKLRTFLRKEGYAL